MSTEQIDIVVKESGATQASASITKIGESADRAGKSVSSLQTLLKTAAAAFGVHELEQLVDGYRKLEGMLNVAGVAQNNMAGSMDKLNQIANETRQPLSQVGTLYSRMAQAGKDLGASQSQLFTFIKATGQALAINGTDSQTAAGGLLQLSQAMGDGKLRGQEYNSMLSSMRPLLIAAAAHMDGTGGSINRMTAMVKEGKVTSKDFFDAVIKGSNDLDDSFSKSLPLISQAFTPIKNNLTLLIGRLDESYGISTKFIEAMKKLSDNLVPVGKEVLSVVAGFALFKTVTGTIALVDAAMTMLNRTMMSNPFLFWASLLTSAVTALILFRDQINFGINDTTSLGDVFRAIAVTIGPFIESVKKIAEEALPALKKPIEEVTKLFDKFSISSVLHALAVGFDGILTLENLFKDKFLNTWDHIFGNDLVTKTESVTGRLLSGMKSFASKAFEHLSSGTVETNPFKYAMAGIKNTFGIVSTEVTDAFADDFKKASTTVTQDLLTKLENTANEISKKRLAEENKPKPQITDTTGSTSNIIDPVAVDKAKKALDQLLGKFDSVRNAQNELTKAQLVLNEAQKQGLITHSQNIQYMDQITKQLQDQLHPVEALNRERQHEIDLLKLDSAEREIQKQLYDDEIKFKKEGVTVSAQQQKQMEDQLRLTQQMNREYAIRNQYTQQYVEPQQKLMDGQKVLNELSQKGKINPDQYSLELNKLKQDALAGNNDLSSGLEIGLLKVQETATKISQSAANVIMTIYSSASNELARGLTGANKSFKEALYNMAVAVQQAVAQMVAQYMLLATVKAIAGIFSTPSVSGGGGIPLAGGKEWSPFGAATDLITSPPKAFGGEFTVGGSGGTDSKLAAFRVTPGEKVKVTTPSQERKENSSQPASNNVKILNIIDPGVMEDYMTSDRGEKVVLNIMQRNKTQISSF